MLSHACELSGPNSFSNHIQNAQYDYRDQARALLFTIFRNSFL